jgi:hypothetical protein
LYFLQQQGLKITTATNISLGCLSVSAIVFLLGGYVMERVGRRVLFVYFQYVVVFSHRLELSVSTPDRADIRLTCCYGGKKAYCISP